MHIQPSAKVEAYQPTNKVIPFPGKQAPLATDNALWAAFDSGVFAALRDVSVGPASQAVYTALMRRLPNVHPSLTRLATDTGLSRSTVARALTVLETIDLIKRHQGQNECGAPDTTVYELADLRNPEGARHCQAQIRGLIKKQKTTSSKGGSRTSATTVQGGGSRMGATRGSCTGAPEVVAPVRPKDTNKKQTKHQEASPLVGGGNIDDFREEILRALRRWGITNPAYLLDPASESAIPELIQRPHEAVRLIDKAMKMRQWTPEYGPGLRVSHLQGHVREAIEVLEADRRAKEIRLRRLVRQAHAAIEDLPRGEVPGVEDLPPERREELLRRGLDALDQPEEVIPVIVTDRAASRRIVACELEREILGTQLDAMSDDELDQLSQELFSRRPKTRSIFRNFDLRSKFTRGLLMEQLRIRASASSVEQKTADTAVSYRETSRANVGG